MTIKAVLFDLDGTLLDSIGGILASFAYVLGRHLPAKRFTRMELILRIGEPVPVQMLRFADGDRQTAARMTDDYREHNFGLLTSMPLYPGVKETLGALRARGLATGLVTSKAAKSAAVSVAGHGLEALFDLVMTADDTPRHKPDPMPLLVAAERLRITPAAIIYVGDSVHDLRCAQDAGALDVAALWGPFERATLAALGPRYMLECLPDLLALPEVSRVSPS